MTELFSWDVESGTIASKFTLDAGAGRNSISTDQAYSGTKSIKFASGGGDNLVADLGSGHTTIYLRFYWYFSSSTTSTGSGSGDHGFRLTHRGANYFSNGQIDTLPLDTAGTQWGFDIFDGSGPTYENTSYERQTVLPKDQWFKFEMYIDIGTAGNADGTVRVYINDSEIINDVESVQFRASSGGSLTQIDTLCMSTNWDNGTALWYYDDIYVSDTDEIGGGDVTAPTLSSADEGTPTADGCTGASVSTNEGNGTLYWAVVSNGGSATDAQIKAGSGGNIVSGKAGSQSVSSTGTQVISSITGLSAATGYQLLFLHSDASSNDSSQASVDLFTLVSNTAVVIWQDTFETDTTTEYYERNAPAGGSFGRSTDDSYLGSYAIKSLAVSGNGSNSNWWVGFGGLPPNVSWPAFAQPSGVDSSSRFTDVTLSVRYWTGSPWAGYTGTGHEGDLKMLRISVFGDSTGSQAAVLHVWGDNTGEKLFVDAVRGTDGGTGLATSGWNDTGNFTWFSTGTSTSAVNDPANSGTMYLIQVRMKLNTAGNSDGLWELWVNGTKEVEDTGLNWVDSYTSYGINTVHLERYWNSGAPGNDVSYFDQLVITDNSTGESSVGGGTSFSYFR